MCEPRKLCSMSLMNCYKNTEKLVNSLASERLILNIHINIHLIRMLRCFELNLRRMNDIRLCEKWFKILKKDCFCELTAFRCETNAHAYSTLPHNLSIIFPNLHKILKIYQYHEKIWDVNSITKLCEPNYMGNVHVYNILWFMFCCSIKKYNIILLLQYINLTKNGWVYLHL